MLNYAEVEEWRQQGALLDALGHWLRPPEGLADVADLPGVVEEHQADRTGDVNQIFRVEQHALVAANLDARDRIARRHGPNVEAADTVLTAEEDLLEDWQDHGVAVRPDVLARHAEPERRPLGVREVPDALGARVHEARVAANA